MEDRPTTRFKRSRRKPLDRRFKPRYAALDRDLEDRGVSLRDTPESRGERLLAALFNSAEAKPRRKIRINVISGGGLNRERAYCRVVVRRNPDLLAPSDVHLALITVHESDVLRHSIRQRLK